MSRTNAIFWEAFHSRNLRFEGLTLTVDSVAKSIEFDGETLGLEVAYRSEPAFALIKVGGDVGGTIGLLSIDEARKEGAEPMPAARRRSIHVEFTTDDLDARYEEWLTRGMTFSEPPHDVPWERVMTGFDPDGYSVEIAQGRRVGTEKYGRRANERSLHRAGRRTAVSRPSRLLGTIRSL